jgi:hypothetical protein
MMDLVEGRAPSPQALRLQERYGLLHADVDRGPGAGRIGPRFALRHAHLIASENVAPFAGAAAGTGIVR